jgi:adenine/guanine phosphoribosyltransferase-like PRPP-binding protein
VYHDLTPLSHLSATASGTTIRALMNLIEQAGAKLVGIGALVEKSFEVSV